jgi:hypothetical protein
VLHESCGEVGAAEDESVFVALPFEVLDFRYNVVVDQFCVGPIGTF